MSFERFDTGEIAWEPADRAIARATSGPVAPESLVRGEVDRLDQFRRPAGFTKRRWYTFLKDARGFAERWLDLAIGCGWTLADLYGLGQGVVFLLDGREVLSIDENRIIIGNATGAPNTFYRHAPGVSVPFDRSSAQLIWVALRLAEQGADL